MDGGAIPNDVQLLCDLAQQQAQERDDRLARDPSYHVTRYAWFERPMSQNTPMAAMAYDRGSRRINLDVGLT
jgi:hypothetical protein